MDSIKIEGFDAALSLIEHIEHLPDRKRRELARVIEILFSSVTRFQASKLSEKGRAGKILKVLLFGSYARGDWVEDRISGYRSDYDLLIVVNTKAFAEEDDLWEGIEDELLKEQLSGRIATPVVPIVHDLADVNDQLSRGRPFFADIAKDGIVLYEKAGHPLAHPKPLTPEERLAEAKSHFEQWLPLARDALTGAELMLEKNIWRHGVFMLHQATESAYHCALLTLTLYSPKSHRIKALRSKAENVSPQLIDAWPRATRFSRRCFELLARAYVEARYSAKYKINTEELTWLVGRVQALQLAVETACQEHLNR